MQTPPPSDAAVRLPHLLPPLLARPRPPSARSPTDEATPSRVLVDNRTDTPLVLQWLDFEARGIHAHLPLRAPPCFWFLLQRCLALPCSPVCTGGTLH